MRGEDARQSPAYRAIAPFGSRIARIGRRTRLPGSFQYRLRGRHLLVDAERFAEKQRLLHVDAAVCNLVWIASDLGNLDPVPPELGSVKAAVVRSARAPRPAARVIDIARRVSNRAPQPCK